MVLGNLNSFRYLGICSGTTFTFYVYIWICLEIDSVADGHMFNIIVTVTKYAIL